MGGFAPLPWKSGGGYLTDSSGQAFVFAWQTKPGVPFWNALHGRQFSCDVLPREQVPDLRWRAYALCAGEWEGLLYDCPSGAGGPGDGRDGQCVWGSEREAFDIHSIAVWRVV